MISGAFRNKGIKIFRYSIGIVCVAVLLALVFVMYIRWFEVPSSHALLHPGIKESSVLMDTKGRKIGEYINEYRNVVAPEAINPYIKQCVIAVEDARFYNHKGVDVKAMLRVAFKTLLMGDKESGGGSTITQQLAKQLYPRPRISNSNWLYGFYLVKSKIKEWFIAWKLEKLYTKEEILAMYLNKFEFVNGAFGIDAAAMTYFAKHQDALTLGEAATLAGMLKNPSLYNPVRNPELVERRRNVVLDKVLLHEAIEAKKQRADFSKFARFKAIDTIVPYFKFSLESYLYQLIRTQHLVREDGTYYDIFSDGLTIESTIDLDMQRYAEQASLEHMQWIQGWFDKDWKKIKPWDYQAGDAERAQRMDVIENRAKMSPRYASLRKRILEPELIKLGVLLTDADIEKLIAARIDEKLIKTISASLQEVLKNPRFVSVKNAYNQLESAYKLAFGTKLKMKIFDYVKGEKEVEMTPMDSVKYHLLLLQSGLVAIDPHNGYVKCWNGGLNYRYFNLDHVNMRRSIGSTAKPFVYSLAMSEKKIKPCDAFKDTIYTIFPGEGDFKNKEPWSPQNATKINTGLMYNLYHGLMYSKNTITVRLLKELGSVRPLIELWNKMGISKEDKLPNGRKAVPDWPSIGLGAIDISLLQLTSAYTAFANEGKWVKPVLVKCIRDKTGKIIYRDSTISNQVIEPLNNSIMLDMLVNNESHDFSMHLKSVNGGKTGTTDDQSDGWYIGLTPGLVVGIWTGGDEKWVRFLREDVGQGFFTARPVFEKFIRKLEKDSTGIYDYKAKFVEPPVGFKELTNCPKKKTEAIPEAIRGSQPLDAD